SSGTDILTSTDLHYSATSHYEYKIRSFYILLLRRKAGKDFSIVTTQAKPSCTEPQVAVVVFKNTLNRIIHQAIFRSKVFKILSVVTEHTILICSEPDSSIFIF